MAKRVSSEEFDAAAEKFTEALYAQDILSVPGVLELLIEHYNNAIMALAIREGDEV